MSRLSVHVLDEREPFPLLHDILGFATAQLGNAGVAVNTIRNKVPDLAVLLRWEQTRGRDLIAEFRCGHILTLADAISLCDFAKLVMRDLKSARDTAKKQGDGDLEFFAVL